MYCLGSTVVQTVFNIFVPIFVHILTMENTAITRVLGGKKYCSHVNKCIPGKYNHYINLSFWCNSNTIVLRSESKHLQSRLLVFSVKELLSTWKDTDFPTYVSRMVDLTIFYMVKKSESQKSRSRGSMT